MALKLDMSNTYDKVEWSYLEVAMKALGFNEQWWIIVMVCISIVSYSVLFNGRLGRYFKPKGELQHGDPLSPYFFLFVPRDLVPW